MIEVTPDSQCRLGPYEPTDSMRDDHTYHEYGQDSEMSEAGEVQPDAALHRMKKLAQ